MHVNRRHRLPLSLLVALLCGLLQNLAVPARPAHAAVPVVSGIGNGFYFAFRLEDPRIMTVTTTAPVAAGNSIVVGVTFRRTIVMATTSVSVSCSDPTNGTYSLDGPILINGDNNGDTFYSAVCAKHNSAALPTGTTIRSSRAP